MITHMYARVRRGTRMHILFAHTYSEINKNIEGAIVLSDSVVYRHSAISCRFYRLLVFCSFGLKAEFNRQFISVSGTRAVFWYYCLCQVFVVDMNT